MLDFIRFHLSAIAGWVLAEIGRNMFEERKELKTRLALLRILNVEIQFNFDLVTEEMKQGDPKPEEGQFIPFQIDFFQGSVSNLFFLEPHMYSNIQTHYVWIKAYLASVTTLKEATIIAGNERDSLDWIIKKSIALRKSYIQDIQSNGETTLNLLGISISNLELEINKYYKNKGLIAWNFVRSLPERSVKFIKILRKEH